MTLNILFFTSLLLLSQHATIVLNDDEAKPDENPFNNKPHRRNPIDLANEATSSKLSTTEAANSSKPKAWTFRRYCEKYDSIRVIRMAQTKLRRRRIKAKNVFDEVVSAMDPTEDLMALKIEPAKFDLTNLRPVPYHRLNETQLHPDDTESKLKGTKVYLNDSRRYPAWGPEKNKHFILPYNENTKESFDPYYIRARLFELMKQAIYSTRQKMVPMQMIRRQFMSNSLYKMGFLISKTDNKCKVYSKVAWLAWRACMNFRQKTGGGKQHTILEMLPTEERLLHLRLEIDLLVDLVMTNERRAMEVIAKYASDRLKRFKFQD